MARTPTRKTTRPARKTGGETKPKVERRRAPRGKLQLLTAFRCYEGETTTLTGFARALNLSAAGALLESPDPLTVGQTLEMEFLLDDNRIAQTRGQVTRVSKQRAFYHIAVEFVKLPAPTRRLIVRQVTE